MATVKFYLKRSKKDQTAIFARLSFKYYETNDNGNPVYKQLKYYTGETIDPDYWDKKNQCAKETKKFPEYPEFNQRLNDIESIILDVHRKLLNDGRGNELNPETLRDLVNATLNKNNKVVKPISNKTGFLEFIQLIINESKTGERTTENGTRIKPRTLSSYKTTLENLKTYETEKKRNLKFSDITIEFYNKYVKYLNDKKRAVNTIGGHIKNIKVFMSIANDRGLTENKEYQKKDFKKIEEETQTIYLTETELLKIYNKDFSKNKKLETVRDIFIIGCYTGLRFSDLKQLRKEHFSDNTITIATVKTGETVVIPLHWTVKEIFNKYEYTLPRVISNQKFNKYLKTVGEKSKINDNVIITETRGGMRFDTTVKKHSLISVHTARRSFATNMFLNDIPTLSIMKITGHRTEKTFLKYIKITPEENANKLLKHPFFSQSHLKVV
jgi:integrase